MIARLEEDSGLETWADTFWRKAKYEWLGPTDYGSFGKLRKKIKYIFNNIGLEYKTQFYQMMV